MSDSDKVLFISPYEEATVNRPRQNRKRKVGGEVVTEVIRQQPFEFKNGRYLATPEEAEELRNHFGYANPHNDEVMKGDKFFTEAIGVEDEEGAQAGGIVIDGKSFDSKEEALEYLQSSTSEEEEDEGGDESKDELEALEGVSNKGEAVKALAQAGVDTAELPDAENDSKAEIVEAAHSFGFYYPGYE